MNSLPTRAILGAATALLAAVAAAALGVPFALGLASAAAMAALASVAFAAQSERFRDERRLVYRPVYARRHGVQRRINTDE